jgi:hypothetical protein
MIYLDSAAVVKLVHAEPESAALRRWLEERTGTGWISSVLTCHSPRHSPAFPARADLIGDLRQAPARRGAGGRTARRLARLNATGQPRPRTEPGPPSIAPISPLAAAHSSNYLDEVTERTGPHVVPKQRKRRLCLYHPVHR